MRRRLIWVGFIFSAAALPAAVPTEDPVLPLSIPGYELRTLDIRKPILFDVNGARVRVSLPIFLYYPTSRAERREAMRLLRQAYDEAIRLAQEQEWSAAELHRMLAAMDASLDLLERNP